MIGHRRPFSFFDIFLVCLPFFPLFSKGFTEEQDSRSSRIQITRHFGAALFTQGGRGTLPPPLHRPPFHSRSGRGWNPDPTNETPLPCHSPGSGASLRSRGQGSCSLLSSSRALPCPTLVKAPTFVSLWALPKCPLGTRFPPVPRVPPLLPPPSQESSKAL